MRCYVCDYSPDTPSIYNQGLALSGGRRSLIELADGRCICQLCYDRSLDDPDNEETLDDEFDYDRSEDF